MVVFAVALVASPVFAPSQAHSKFLSKMTAAVRQLHFHYIAYRASSHIPIGIGDTVGERNTEIKQAAVKICLRLLLPQSLPRADEVHNCAMYILG